MHVAIVSETYPPEINGVALTVQHMECGLRDEGHRVSLVRPRQTADATRGAEGDILLVPGWSIPRYPGLQFGLPQARLLRERWQVERPDVVYVATEGPLGWSAIRSARGLGIPVAAGFHTRFDEYMRRYGVPWLAPVAWRWMRHVHNLAQRTLVPTEALRSLLQTRGFAAVSVLGRSVDAELFHPNRRNASLRARWGCAEDELAVIHVGRIAAEKNLDAIIQSFDAVRRVRPDARMIWVGAGPAMPTLAAAHPDHVFCGLQRGVDLAEHFASADLFLFPSTSETFGNVTLEAMASGVPTVAFAYGAAAAHITHEQSGLLVPLEQPDQFATMAASLAADPLLRARMATAARGAIGAIDPATVTRHLIRILQELCDEPTRTASLHPAH